MKPRGITVRVRTQVVDPAARPPRPDPDADGWPGSRAVSSHRSRWRCAAAQAVRRPGLPIGGRSRARGRPGRHGHDGHPMLGLGLDDFVVGIDGGRRRVVVRRAREVFTPEIDIVNAVRPVRTPGEIAGDSRVYVLAVDLAGFPTGRNPAARARRCAGSSASCGRRISSRSTPSRTARRRLDLTHDHPSVAFALRSARRPGATDRPGVFNLAPRRSSTSRPATMPRCRRWSAASAPVGRCRLCSKAIEGEASALASYLEAESVERLDAVSNLVRSLAIDSGPEDRRAHERRPDQLDAHRRDGLTSPASSAPSAPETANSQTNLYVLHWDIDLERLVSAPTRRRRRRAADRYRSGFADRDAVEPRPRAHRRQGGRRALPCRGRHGRLRLRSRPA